jgi:hypothetical protein
MNSNLQPLSPNNNNKSGAVEDPTLWYVNMAFLVPIIGCVLGLISFRNGPDHLLLSTTYLETIRKYLVPGFINALIGPNEREIILQNAIFGNILSVVTIALMLLTLVHQRPITERRMQMAGLSVVLRKLFPLLLVAIFLYAVTLLDVYNYTRGMNESLDRNMAWHSTGYIYGRIIIIAIPGIWSLAALLCASFFLGLALYFRGVSTRSKA